MEKEALDYEEKGILIPQITPGFIVKSTIVGDTVVEVNLKEGERLFEVAYKNLEPNNNYGTHIFALFGFNEKGDLKYLFPSIPHNSDRIIYNLNQGYWNFLNESQLFNAKNLILNMKEFYLNKDHSYFERIFKIGGFNSKLKNLLDVFVKENGMTLFENLHNVEGILYPGNPSMKKTKLRPMGTVIRTNLVF